MVCLLAHLLTFSTIEYCDMPVLKHFVKISGNKKELRVNYIHTFFRDQCPLNYYLYLNLARYLLATLIGTRVGPPPKKKTDAGQLVIIKLC